MAGDEGGRERDGGTAVGELKFDFRSERVTIVADLVGFLADGLSEFVKGEFAVFENWRFRLLCSCKR